MKNIILTLISIVILSSCGSKNSNSNTSNNKLTKNSNSSGEQIISSYENGNPQIIKTFKLEGGENVAIYEKEYYLCFLLIFMMLYFDLFSNKIEIPFSSFNRIQRTQR